MLGAFTHTHTHVHMDGRYFQKLQSLSQEPGLHKTLYTYSAHVHVHVQYSTVQYSTVQYSTVQYSTVHAHANFIQPISLLVQAGHTLSVPGQWDRG